MEVYNSINDCLPRDEGDAAESKDIQLRHQMCVEEISTKRLTDLDAGWYSKLAATNKEMVAEDERAAPPTGEGYVYTIHGLHWHNNPADTGEQGHLYVMNTFLKNLQKQQTPPIEGFPVRDVRRLGISHATLVSVTPGTFYYDPEGGKIDKTAPRTNLFGGPGTLPGSTLPGSTLPGSTTSLSARPQIQSRAFHRSRRSPRDQFEFQAVAAVAIHDSVCLQADSGRGAGTTDSRR